MILKDGYLSPFWENTLSDSVICGFTLPVLGNMALTRESRKNGKDTCFNKETLLHRLHIDDFSLFSPLQQHSADYVEVHKDIANCGRNGKSDALPADAAITEEAGILLLTTWADCIPVLLYSPEKNIIASIHSGWKGTYHQIVNNVLAFFNKKGVSFEHIYAAVGPGIKKCCYQVGDEFLEYFQNDHSVLFKRKNNTLFFDLSYCVYLQLLKSGIKKENIDYSTDCTCCNSNPSFSSFRREKDGFEGQGAFIAMRKKDVL